jgi:hypothetical protein
VHDSTTLHVKDTEDQSAFVEKEAQERVSRVEAENVMVLASARKDAEGVLHKIALLTAWGE